MSTEQVPPPPLPDRLAWAQDDKADKENENWADERALKSVRHTNNRRILKTYGWVVACLMILTSLMGAVTVAIWGWHNLAPSGYLWLSPHQLSKIESMLFSGGAGAFISFVVQSHLKK